MKDIGLLQIMQNKKNGILKEIEDLDARYAEGTGELYSGDYAEMRDVLDGKLDVVNEILSEYEKITTLSQAELNASVVKITEEDKYNVNVKNWVIPAKYKKDGQLVDCQIVTVFDNGDCRISIPDYDGRGRYSGYTESTVNVSELFEIADKKPGLDAIISVAEQKHVNTIDNNVPVVEPER